MRKFHICGLLTVSVAALFILTSCEGKGPRKVGEFCVDETDCESGLCYDSQCLNPDDDYDHDGLKNGVEKNITGTDYGLIDSDSDGIDDGTEVGNDPLAAIDVDGDGINDALESFAISADPDKDCIPDQYDAENDVYTDDMARVVELHCTMKGVCGEGVDNITALCTDGNPVCDYSAVEGWEAVEAGCDAKDNDCDGKTDEELTPPDQPECSSVGVCADDADSIFRVCRDGSWQCEYAAIDEFEKVEVSCDGRDNNCDGSTDEGLVEQSCFVKNEYGKCAGLTGCSIYGNVECVGPTPMAEICNNVDDNCNGLTDEDLIGIECSRTNDFGTCEGTTTCNMSTGGTECSAPEPSDDICDTIDNDCDGETDENNICNRTSVVKVHVYGASIPVTAHRASTTEGKYDVLVGATVDFFLDNCPTTDADVPVWSGVTAADGALVMPVEPGYWCVRISADGFQTMLSQNIYTPAEVVVPLDSVLLRNGMTTRQLSLCGRVVEQPTYSTTLDTSNDGGSEPPAAEFVPVPDALVTVVGAETLDTIATSISDQNGYWCVFGLQTLPADGAVQISVVKDTFYPGMAKTLVGANTLSYVEIFMSLLPTVETICLAEGFENEVFSNGWEATGATDYPVQWVVMQSYPCVSQGYTMGCANAFANEIDQTAATTVLCKDVEYPINGCVFQAGSLPSSISGYSFAWFGNPQTCSYSPTIETCGDVTSRITGTLTSPWIDAMTAYTLFIEFQSAWEVEGILSQTDMMYVEAQTSEMEGTNSWSTVANLKEMTTTTRAAGTGITGLTSGGVDSAPTWEGYRLGLDAFKGTWFRLRFRFDSIDGNNNFLRGWLIDDVMIKGAGCTSAPGV